MFIAGGTGIAPLRAMLQHALHLPHRNIGLFYSARTPDEFAYETELRALARRGRHRAAADGDARDRRPTGPARAAGLNRAALEELVHDPATLCFVCGPPALVDEMPKILAGARHPARSADQRSKEW